jgi:small-conductance mechanosensitive channel
MWDGVVTRAAMVMVVAVAGAWLIAKLSGELIRHLAQRRFRPLLSKLYRSCYQPYRTLLILAVLRICMHWTGLKGAVLRGFQHGLLVALLGSAAWLTIKVLYILEDTAFRRFPIEVADNRRARRARTQIGMLRRLTAASVTVLAMAIALTTFAPLRTFGASLIASAGVVGLVAGLAAHATLSHVFAGLQLAFTDALRLDDVVVIENEWGHIEEIRLTYVVVRLWDERRLVLPTSYFTTAPFQNWTRNDARVLGSVLLHLDYCAPVEELRRETRRILETSPLWDGRTWILQVIDSTPSTMVIRVLASAADAPTAWDLRCVLRERLILFMQTDYPQCLPRVRALRV